MGIKEKSQTPQPQKVGKQQGKKTPQTAPEGKITRSKKATDEASMKEVTTKLFQNGGATPGKGKATPKAGEKRKLDTTLPSDTPSKGKQTPAKGKQTPVKGKQTPGKDVQTPSNGKQTPGKGKQTPGKGKKSEESVTPASKGKTPVTKTPKTPQAATPKASQGRKTPQPKKTPQAKTPASAGKKGKKTPQKAAEDEEDDDDEDDIDEDFDMEDMEDDSDDVEEDMDDDSDEDEDDEKASALQKAVAALGKKGAKAVMQQDDEDDEDDDDEDDDEDDDNEDDDEDDVDEDAILKNIQALRKESEKSDEKQKKAATKQNGETAAKQQQLPTKQQQLPTEQKQQNGDKAQKSTQEKVDTAASNAEKNARDRRTLFVKNLPPTVTVSEVKTLSKDIKEVRLRITVRSNRRQQLKRGYAYVEFASEAVADKNYKQLQGAKLKDNDLVVDFVGQKSAYASDKPQQEISDPDPLRLFITGFGSNVKEADLHKLFPKAQLSMPSRKKDNVPVGMAFAAFPTPEQCKAAHGKLQGAKLKGERLIVLYAKKRPGSQQGPKSSLKNKDMPGGPATKKAKLEGDEDDGSDEEDDDDDEGDDSDADEDDDSEDGDEEEDDDDDDDDDDEDDD